MEEEWKNIPLGAVHCDEKTRSCTLWFIQTRKGVTKPIEIKTIEIKNLDFKKLGFKKAHEAEVKIEEALSGSYANID